MPRIRSALAFLAAGPAHPAAMLLLTLLIAVFTTPGYAADDHMKFVQKGRAESEQLWRRGFTLGDEALDARLQGILDTLVAGTTNPPGVALKVRVFRSPENNAFALPDGSIYVFAGLLSQLTSRDQLAFILRHEAEHALGDHALKHLRSTNTKLGVLSALSVVSSLAIGSALVDALVQSGLGLTAAASVNGYGRELEREADRAAAVRLGPAGFDGCGAAEALEVLRRQEKQPGRVANTFWGSHPLLEDRIRDVRSVAQVRDCAFDSTRVSDTYAPIKWPMLKLSAGLWVAAREPIRAARTAEAYLARFPGDPDACISLGEAYALAAERDAAAAARSGTPGHASPDTLELAASAFRRALDLGGPDYRPPLRGLARVAEQRRDTIACIGFLERYLAGNAQVRDRRMLHTKLDTLRAHVPGGAPTPTDSAGISPAGKVPEQKEK